jgi:CxxC motif-containing protein
MKKNRNTSKKIRLTIIPVKTTSPIPKDKLFEAMEKINKITVSVPVGAGSVLVKDFIPEGTDLIVCRSVKE